MESRPDLSETLGTTSYGASSFAPPQSAVASGVEERSTSAGLHSDPASGQDIRAEITALRRAMETIAQRQEEQDRFEAPPDYVSHVAH